MVVVLRWNGIGITSCLEGESVRCKSEFCRRSRGWRAFCLDSGRAGSGLRVSSWTGLMA